MDHARTDKTVFSKIVLTQVGALHHFALSLCKNNFDADDLVSETILKAYENFSNLKDLSKSKQWLFRIMNNQFLNSIKTQRKLIKIGDPTNEYDIIDSEKFSLFESIAKSSYITDGNPEKQFISELTKTQIEKAVNELPGEFRITLILCDMEEFSYSEISSILKIPIGTVRSRIARARIILQKKLWLQAKELGIKEAITVQPKVGYTCTCGREELKHSSSIVK